MNLPANWDPFKELKDVQDRLTHILRGGHRPPPHTDGKESITVAEWSPLVDIIEDDKEYLIKAELPEIKKEQIKVTVENGVLIISGHRKFEKEEKSKKYHRVERLYGSFTRSFSLPEDADATKIHGEFKDGLLILRIAKSSVAHPKQVEVKIT